MSPVSVVAAVLTVLWLAAALVGVFRANDLWGWIWTAVFAVAAFVTAGLAGTLVFRLLPGQVKPIVGKGISWVSIESISVRRLPLGLASIQLEVSQGRSLALRDLDILGTIGWVNKVSAELAARAGVEIHETQDEHSSESGQGAE